jgi:methyl-accepting chemotaxis protein
MEQISKSIVHMDENTQRNAGLVEETNAATQSLLDQARELVRVVGRFKLEEGSSLPEVAAPAPLGRLEAPKDA